jgi:cytochrome bd-type quinol oxidase subunit 2
MKNLSFIGLLLLVISGLLFYFTTNFEVEKIGLSHFMGILGGVGIGLIIGGIVGYVSKGTSMKADRKKKEIAQLQKEKMDLEKQAAELAKQNLNDIK